MSAASLTRQQVEEAEKAEVQKERNDMIRKLADGGYRLYSLMPQSEEIVAGINRKIEVYLTTIED